MPRRPSLARVALTMLIALAVSTVAVLLGLWQFHRHEDKTAAREAYAAAQSQPTAELDSVVPPGSTTLPANAQWRTVTVTGTFEADTATYLRGRPVDGTASWQFLAWLDTDDDRSVLVSTGWIPQPGRDEQPSWPAYPDHEVSVTGIIRAWEEDDGKTPSDSVTRITPSQLAQPQGEEVPGYLMIREYCNGTACSPTVIGDQVPLPDVSPGPHLSYAIQWWLFAVLAPVGAVLLLRHDAHTEPESVSNTNGDHDTGMSDHQAGPANDAPGQDSSARSAPVAAVRRRRMRRPEPSDEDIEDAL